MAKNILPVDFKDDIMNSAMNGKRRYRMINNSDGTISLEDVTTYDQVGSAFGSAQMNATNKAVNAAADASKIIDDIDAIRATTQAGYMAGALALKQVDDSLGGYKLTTKDGKIAYYKESEGADSAVPFTNGVPTEVYYRGSSKSFTAEIGSKYLVSACRLDSGGSDLDSLKIVGANVILDTGWEKGTAYNGVFPSTGLAVLEATAETVTVNQQFGSIIVAKLIG